MKRILLPLLALCLCLTACGGTADEAGYDPPLPPRPSTSINTG